MSGRAILAIIGGGNMGRAIILGALDAKLLAPGEVVVCEPDSVKRDAMRGWGVQVVAGVEEAMERMLPAPAGLRELRESYGLAACGGQVLLAVKPQTLAEVAGRLRPELERTARVVITILAGTTTARVASELGGGCPVVRVMPNTPARLRKSMTAIARGAGANAAHESLAYDLFASIGEVVRLDELLMDAYTALAGSGPAYVFYLAEAMVRAAREVGFDQITADRIVRQTIAGAAGLLADSSEPPEALRAAVTSKGGTTEAAVGELERAGVMGAVVRAVVAGRDRGRELGAAETRRPHNSATDCERHGRSPLAG